MSSRAIQATLSRNTSACSSLISLSASWAAVILALSAIVVFSLRRSLEQTDDHEPRGGRGHIRPRGLATPHSATRPTRPAVSLRFQALKALIRSNPDHGTLT